MSQLQIKSDILRASVKLLHKKRLYPTVAHCSYYSCLQLSKHLWLHPMNKTEENLEAECAANKKGTHGMLINATRKYILSSNKISCSNDSRNFYSKMQELKRLRVSADYSDIVFTKNDSAKSISLANDVHPILKKYL